MCRAQVATRAAGVGGAGGGGGSLAKVESDRTVEQTEPGATPPAREQTMRNINDGCHKHKAGGRLVLVLVRKVSNALGHSNPSI